MSIALLITDRNLSTLYHGLQMQLPGVDIQCWPNITKPEKVRFVVAWQQPDNCWQKFPRLSVISSLGAGCDGLLNDPLLPENVIITRIVDSSLAEQMAEYVLCAILLIKRRFNDYFKQQEEQKWQPLAPIIGKKVTVLGVGKIGDKVATTLVACGYQVVGWSRTEKSPRSYPMYYGKTQLPQALTDVDFVVSTLPFTAETKHSLNDDFFKLITNKAWLINVGRGQVLNEQDLLSALTNNYIQGAVLDVVENEPLAENHLFWHHPNIIITPHVSAITDQQAVIAQITENYLFMNAGKTLNNRVDLKTGY